jgi:hypothetical protein
VDDPTGQVQHEPEQPQNQKYGDDSAKHLFKSPLVQRFSASAFARELTRKNCVSNKTPDDLQNPRRISTRNPRFDNHRTEPIFRPVYWDGSVS